MELVAPAGSFNGLRASINGGADAVYLGLPLFSARAKAENFDNEALKKAIEYAHLFGVRVFVALNTLIKDCEMSRALEAARYAYSVGADAAIVQDLRFIKELKRALPKFTLHASTQLGIHNADGAKALIDLGISRAVAARETLPSDIAEIKKTGIQLEYFVQGALCIAFSGNCYFSSLASSYSGNRGKCMQLCRKPYFFKGNRGYYLSAKDLCLYDKLNELEALGVDAVKIEGRMRSDEYAYQAVKTYKSNMPIADAKNALKSVFNRGEYCSGYMEHNAPFNVVYAKSQANIGKFIGKIDKLAKNSVSVNGFTPHVADGFKIMRSGIEVCGATVRDGKIITEVTCKPGDELRRTFDGALSESIKNASRKIDLFVTAVLEPEKRPHIIIEGEKASVSVLGDKTLPTAISQALTAEAVERSLSKTSDYPFTPHIKISMTDNVFMPMSELNDLRRRAYKAIYDEIISKHAIAQSMLTYSGLNYNRFDGHGTILAVESSRQLDKEIIKHVDYVALNPRDYSDFSIPDIDKPILLCAPITMRGADRDIIVRAIDRKGIYGVISNNLYTLKLTDKPILLGIGHNIIGECELPHIKSVESDSLSGGFSYTFGYAPLMTLCHCPYGKCIDCSGTDELKDENNRTFRLRRYKGAYCYWQLLNCVPNYIPSPKDKTNKDKFYDCTAVGKDIILKVLTSSYDGDFTRGNTNKGLK